MRRRLAQSTLPVAVALNNLAAIYRAQGRNAEAEPLYKRALAISEKTLGAEHPKIAVLLGNLSGALSGGRPL